MAFLILNDSSERFPIPSGETVIGRGPHFRVKELSLSRSHALLSFKDGKLSIKPTHRNPTYFYSSTDDEQQVQLEKDEWKDLADGDQISLLSNSYKYKVEILASPVLDDELSGMMQSKKNMETDETLSEICHLSDLNHFQMQAELSHHENFSSSTRDVTPAKENVSSTMPPKSFTGLLSTDLPPCLYGRRCYRKNPVHFTEYSHDFESNKSGSKNHARVGDERFDQNKVHIKKVRKIDEDNKGLISVTSNFRYSTRKGSKHSNSNNKTPKSDDSNILTPITNVSNTCSINNNSRNSNKNIGSHNDNNNSIPSTTHTSSSNSNSSNSQNLISNNSNNSNNSANIAVNPVDVKCDCKISAALRTTVKEGPNKGRQFYCCSKPRGKQCKFFQWADSSNGDSVDNGTGKSGTKRKIDCIDSLSASPGWELVHKTDRNSPNSTFYYQRNITKSSQPDATTKCAT